MPTITVSAPRRRAMWARLRRHRVPKESSTSRAATSTMIPRERSAPMRVTTSCWKRTISWSSSAVWIDAMRKSPWRRTETSMLPPGPGLRRLFAADPEPQVALGLLDAALQVADGVHLPEVDPDRHQGLGDLRREAGDDHAGPHQPGGLHGL